MNEKMRLPILFRWHNAIFNWHNATDSQNHRQIRVYTVLFFSADLWTTSSHTVSHNTDSLRSAFFCIKCRNENMKISVNNDQNLWLYYTITHYLSQVHTHSHTYKVIYSRKRSAKKDIHLEFMVKYMKYHQLQLKIDNKISFLIFVSYHPHHANDLCLWTARHLRLKIFFMLYFINPRLK